MNVAGTYTTLLLFSLMAWVQLFRANKNCLVCGGSNMVPKLAAHPNC